MSKSALITGAAKRLGKAMAQHLARQGWSIAIHYNGSRNEALLLQSELRQLFPEQQFEIFNADLNLTPKVENLLIEVMNKMQNLELLINNASLFEHGTIIETSDQLFNRQMNVNFRAPFILTRDFARSIGRGIVVNFVDTRITTNKSNFSAYSLSKKALWELTRMSALEFGPEIRMNAIAPGLTLPPEEKGEDYLWNLSKNIAMKRPGGIDPILKSLDFILNNDYLTGQLLFCDGGENLGLTV
jgi:NAD(P)-dependent dehydrogenase (short-subunit alcohol dehydrogenase family)